jgi:putative aldouronate transport system substrate-binding protein
MKIKSGLLALACFALVATSVMAGGGQAGTSSSAGQEKLSAPGVLPITKEKSTLDVFMVEMYTVDLTNNTALADLEAVTNVHLNINIANMENATDKINLLLNTGEYPEVIMYSGFFTASDLIKYGYTEKMFLPLDDLVDQHAPFIKDYFQKYPWVKEGITTALDGKIYGLPFMDSGAEGLVDSSVEFKNWINKGWLDKLGLKMPTTTVEYREVLRAFKTRDPNGNGKADEIPLTGAYGTWAADPYLFLLNAFGYYHQGNVMLKNDTFYPVANQDYIREGLTYTKGLYDEGLIDPAAFTQTLEQLGAVGSNPGTIIMGGATCGHLAMAIDINDLERSRMYATVEPLTGPTGYKGLPCADTKKIPNAAGFVITDKCKNPALAIKLANEMGKLEWANRFQSGVKGKHWTDADPGTFGLDGITPARYKFISQSTHASTVTRDKDILGHSLRVLEEDWRKYYQVVGDIYDTANYVPRLMMESEKLFLYKADVQPIPPLSYTQDASARLSQIQAPIGDHVKQAFAEFITGRRSLNDAGWNTYKQELDRLGYPEMITIMQTAYNSRRRN